MTMNNKEWVFCEGVCEKDVLHDGEIIFESNYTTWDKHRYRLRTIRYEGHLYEHRTVDSKVVGFRRLR